MIGYLGTEVLKRVTMLKDCFECGANEYGIGMIDAYLNERNNSSIKKYKSVVLEYFKKYTQEIKPEPQPQCPLNTEIKRLL